MFLIPKFSVILIGKVIYGTATGIAIVAIARYFSETVPASRTGRYGFAINLGIVGGVTIILCLGLFKPGPDASADTVKLAMTIFNCVPIAMACVVLLMWTCAFK